MRPVPSALVFTDLDGTLLDHGTYDPGPARPVLVRLRASGVPVIPVTSKTRAEMGPLGAALGLDGPFIVENGAAVLFPEGMDGGVEPLEPLGRFTAFRFGRPYSEARAFLASLPAGAVRGFGDMDAAEAARRTGLTAGEAALAIQRDFTEPFLLEGGGIERVRAAAAEAGFKVLEGGRFFHLVGEGQDKGRAVAWLMQRWGGGAPTLGLGDSPNDFDFLRVVDRPVLVRRPDGRHAAGFDHPRLMRAEGVGPAGWAEAVLQLLPGWSGIEA